jgi:bifunctional DNA-binding transcriptional regulator/antitoxin component of YhaV-PrlF toxin-antitoxin module
MSEQEQSGGGEPTDDPTFLVEAVEVYDGGRLTIPSRLRDRYGVGDDDVVDVQVLREDQPTIVALDLVVDADGRIRVPERKRQLYGLDDGDVVDINVRTTGQTMPDGG